MGKEEYMKDAQGRQVPLELIKDVDILRDQTVRAVMKKTFQQRDVLKEFKQSIWQDLQAFLDISSEQHGVKHGGEKGNITLLSFDGQYKILIAVNDCIIFNEKLQIAKALIDNCIKRWAETSGPEIKALIDDAFQVDKTGNINKARILRLKQLKIEDPEWVQAMAAIADSVTVASTKTYMRFYERKQDGSYQNIPLDVAAL